MSTQNDAPPAAAVATTGTNLLYNRIVFILSLVGLIIAALMWHWHGSPDDIPCGAPVNGTSECADVARSVYSNFPIGTDIPVAMWGTFGYLALAGFAFLRTLLTGSARRDRALVALTAVTAIIGTLFSLRLTYFEINPDYIGKICRWCMTSQAIILAIAIISTVELLRYPRAARSTTDSDTNFNPSETTR